jgi:hypothetical protein
MRWIISGLLLSACLPVVAADYDDYEGTTDLPEHHLRLTVQSLPKKLKSESGTAQATSTVDTAQRLSLGYAYTSQDSVGLFFGTGIDLSKIEDEESGLKTTINQTGIHVEPGISWRVAGGFSIETGIQVGIGAVRASTNVTNAKIDDSSYVEFSPRLRGVYVFAVGLELLAEVGYQYQRFDLKYSQPGFAATVKQTSSGGFAGVGLGWAF